MSTNGLDEYWVPEHVKEYLRRLGFVLPLDDMEPWIRSWDDWMGARGDFYDYRDKDGMGGTYEAHRRSIHPAMRVCGEWGSLLLNEEVKVVCENQKATDWINSFLSSTSFWSSAQATVMRAFERDKEGNWIDEIPDGNDHSIDAVRYALMDDVLRG